MKLITIEEHITEDIIHEKTASFSKRPVSTGELPPSVLKLNRELSDYENDRLRVMDEQNIQMEILSFINSGLQFAPDEEVLKLNESANDFLYEVTKRYPDRYKAFAQLPLSDPEKAAEVLEHCVRDYGFCGALVGGKFRGEFLDNKKFRPVFAKAAELKVPISFHPSIVSPTVSDYYYHSEEGNWSKRAEREFSSAGFGWHLDIGIQAVRMILSGVFDEYPDLVLIAGHWGEGIPMMLDRMDYMLPPEVTGLKKKVSEYYKENIYITPSGIMSEDNLYAMVRVMGADHIIYSMDYPYIQPDNFSSFLENSELSEEEKELIAYKNAERLFGIRI